eukprot:240469-Chlamydomonas_euryale.AAC.1
MAPAFGQHVVHELAGGLVSFWNVLRGFLSLKPCGEGALGCHSKDTAGVSEGNPCVYCGACLWGRSVRGFEGNCGACLCGRSVRGFEGNCGACSTMRNSRWVCVCVSRSNTKAWRLGGAARMDRAAVVRLRSGRGGGRRGAAKVDCAAVARCHEHHIRCNAADCAN